MINRRKIVIVVGTCLTVLSMAVAGCSNSGISGSMAGIPKHAAKVNVTGTWEIPGWDRAVLRQSETTVRGRMGELDVDGLVTGQEVYLYVGRNSRAYYTMALREVQPGVLDGRYYNGLADYATMSHPDRVSNRPVEWRRLPGPVPPK
jgi:hypothetical protein